MFVRWLDEDEELGAACAESSSTPNVATRANTAAVAAATGAKWEEEAGVTEDAVAEEKEEEPVVGAAAGAAYRMVVARQPCDIGAREVAAVDARIPGGRRITRRMAARDHILIMHKML